MEDERLAAINQQKQEAINQSNSMYEGLLNDNQNIYNQSNQYAEQYEQTQNSALDQQLAFQEDLINQQKEEAQKNMEAEQKRAQNDYMAFINPYGNQAESMASSGLLNSGASETSKLGGFNTYQNRLATANKAMQDAFTEYDNAINEARLNNDVQKAQNALTKLQMQLEASQNFYSNKSTISQNQLSNNQALDSEYYNRYQTEYNNIQAEREREEAIRQYEEQLAFQREQFEYQKQQDALAQQNWEREYELSRSAARSSSSSSGSSGGYSLSSGKSGGNSLSGSTSANGRTIAANPYTGTVNPDAQYGVFEWSENPGSGYQPNNVGGSSLSKSGYKVGDIFGQAVGSTGADLSNQSIWQTNGKYYVWDGSINDYIDVTSDVKKSIKTGTNILWGS